MSEASLRPTSPGNITHPPALQTFTNKQVQTFLQAIAKGHNEELSAFKAGIKTKDLSDLLASLPMHALEDAKMMSKLPLAEVKERAVDIMLDARNPDYPMEPGLVLDILERQDPTNWGKRTQIELRPPEPKLAPEEHARLAKLFALPAHTPIEGVIIESPLNENEPAPQAQADAGARSREETGTES